MPSVVSPSAVRWDFWRLSAVPPRWLHFPRPPPPRLLPSRPARRRPLSSGPLPRRTFLAQPASGKTRQPRLGRDLPAHGHVGKTPSARRLAGVLLVQYAL